MLLSASTALTYSIRALAPPNFQTAQIAQYDIDHFQSKASDGSNRMGRGG